jgi:hypothetical protein
MNHRHRSLVVAITGAVLVVLIAWMLNHTRPARTLASPPSQNAEPPRAVAIEAPRGHPPEDGNRSTIAPDANQRITVQSNPGDSEASLEHMLRGVISANAEELALTPADADRLVADALEFQEIQTELMKRYLQETSFDPTTVKLHVPPFPTEGKLLRDMFQQRLNTDFPEGKAERIREHIGGFLDESFHGFGIADQTFIVTRSAEQPSSFELSWEAKIPDGQSASGGNEGMSYPGGSGKMLLTREQIMSGEYRFLEPVISQRFQKIP